jgi:hypothetical protein
MYVRQKSSKRPQFPSLKRIAIQFMICFKFLFIEGLLLRHNSKLNQVLCRIYTNNFWAIQIIGNCASSHIGAMSHAVLANNHAQNKIRRKGTRQSCCIFKYKLARHRQFPGARNKKPALCAILICLIRPLLIEVAHNDKGD